MRRSKAISTLLASSCSGTVWASPLRAALPSRRIQFAVFCGSQEINRMTSHGSRESLSLATYLFVFCWLTATAFAAGPKERTLYGFQGAPDGINPQSTVIAGGGHLYGTTIAGGTGTVCQDLYSTSCGTVFELTPPTTPGGSWTEKVLYNFQGGSDGAWPSGKLMRDITGNLYGTTMAGGSLGLACTAVSSGATGCGTVFRLSPPQTAGADWTESILYVFQGGLDGKEPFNAGLISDGKGNLYGTTALGGDGYCYGQGFNCGTVFRLSPSSAAGGPWTETILYSFNGNQGGFSAGDFPAASLVFDQKGKLYGTTLNPRPGGCKDGSFGGTVFPLSPPPMDRTLLTETLLYSFGTTNNDSFPSSGVLFDKRGNLYGTTKLGGSGACDDQSSYAFPSCGTLFSLNPTTSGGWTLTDLYSC